jgi:hypothetical protein
VLEFEKVGSRLVLRAAPFVLSLAVGLAPSRAAAEPPTAARLPASRAAPASAPLLAYVLGAIGLSGLSVGTTTGFLALNQKAIVEDHCTQTLRVCDARGAAASDTGRTLRDVSTAGFIVGGLGLGLSAYLLLSASEHRAGDVAIAVLVDGAQPQTALLVHF